MIVIVDYGMGNLGSVLKALKRLNIESKISTNADDIEKASKLILPGVGQFANGILRLKELGYIEILNKKVLKDKTPILGICLGMQLFAKSSEEGNVDGLGWINAEVVRFRIEDKYKWKVPHMGWNSISIEKDCNILNGVSQDELFYFVHSYHIKCNDNTDILTSTDYSYRFTSAVQKDNIFGTQFHPEKSHDQGMQILANFAKLV